MASLTVGAEAGAVGADAVVLAAVVAALDVAAVALPAFGADAVAGLARPVGAAVQVATLWGKREEGLVLIHGVL